MRRLAVASAATIGVAVGLAAGAGARGAPAQPYHVSSATLTQSGTQLVWSLTLNRPLARGGASLCLVLQRRRVLGSFCLDRGSRKVRLISGHDQVVPASISGARKRTLVVAFDPQTVGLSFKPLHWQVQSSVASPPCSSQPCRTAFPARPELVRLHTPKLVGCVATGPSLVYQGSSRRREIALTFDDGPWNTPPPSAFLRVLERDHAVGTFFEIGRQIAGYDPGGRYERRMLADGDMIGDHSWSHPDVAKLPVSQQREQLVETIHAIRKATGGFTPCLWRPPYGDISPELISLARKLGLLTIMWDVDPRDWALPGVNAIYDNVVSNAHNGAIVIQHFGGGPRYETVDALPREIATLRRRGYRFVTVAQLLGLRLIYK